MTDATSGNRPASDGTPPKSMVLSYLTMRRKMQRLDRLPKYLHGCGSKQLA